MLCTPCVYALLVWQKFDTKQRKEAPSDGDVNIDSGSSSQIPFACRAINTRETVCQA